MQEYLKWYLKRKICFWGSWDCLWNILRHLLILHVIPCEWFLNFRLCFWCSAFWPKNIELLYYCTFFKACHATEIKIKNILVGLALEGGEIVHLSQRTWFHVGRWPALCFRSVVWLCGSECARNQKVASWLWLCWMPAGTALWRPKAALACMCVSWRVGWAPWKDVG